MHTVTTTNPYKRVNVISKEVVDTSGKIIQEAGILMRVTRAYAAKLVGEGTHTTTSKNKLKSYFNKSMKLYKNGQTFETMIPKLDKAGDYVYEKNKDGQLVRVMVKKFDLEDKKAGHFIHQDQYSGKVYIGLKLKDVEVVMIDKSKVDPNTGKPMEFTKLQPRYQVLVAKFPRY